MELKLKIVKTPDDKLAYRNCVFISDKLKLSTNYIVLKVESNAFLFYCLQHRSIPENGIALTMLQRRWSGARLDTEYSGNGVIFKKLIDTEKLLKTFQDQFDTFPLTVNQPFLFQSEEKIPVFEATIESLEVSTADSFFFGTSGDSKQASSGVLSKGTKIIFKKSDDAVLNLIGKATSMALSTSPIISPDWDFAEMGIGGLDKEFSLIFRRAFASRLFPPAWIHQMGMKHVRGILLFGPPGTGKTLMARQIGKMLNAREPKIVHGPDILNKYVGESEANIRKLFEDAEIEQKKFGIGSGLHIIIFDEIDALCKQRGRSGDSTGVHDNVVNQLLSKMDGVDQLNNVLIIGMTNRKDLIDDALLRPGRFEVQLEINLPDEDGRLQILKIHTTNLKTNEKLDNSVDLKNLAKNTKNFSGAEIEGLVKAATSIAMNRAVKLEGKVKIDPKGIENLKVNMKDFEYALKNDVTPMFGASVADLSLYNSNGITKWCDEIDHIINDGKLILEQTRNGGIISPVSLLLYGEAGSGKTAMAAHLALSSNFPLIKLCSADQMVGFTESAKCQTLKKIFDDAAKSELGCVVIDGIERILEYVSIGPRFSNTILQALLVMMNKRLPKNHKLLIIGTTSCKSVLEQMGIIDLFTRCLQVPQITTVDEIEKIALHFSFFDESTLRDIRSELTNKKILIPLKKLISICEMSSQVSDNCTIVRKFVNLLGDERALF